MSQHSPWWCLCARTLGYSFSLQYKHKFTNVWIPYDALLPASWKSSIYNQIPLYMCKNNTSKALLISTNRLHLDTSLLLTFPSKNDRKQNAIEAPTTTHKLLHLWKSNFSLLINAILLYTLFYSTSSWSHSLPLMFEPSSSLATCCLASRSFFSRTGTYFFQL